jgi:hypothetical protein
MALIDPVAVYNGADNFEIGVLQNLLEDAGIEAFSVEDVSVVGGWMGGLIPEIHKPQVWVARADVERAKPVLDAYERQLADRRAADRAAGQGRPVDIVCEECRQSSRYPREQLGSVQNCPLCGAYVDVTLDTTPDEERITTLDP